MNAFARHLDERGLTQAEVARQLTALERIRGEAERREARSIERWTVNRACQGSAALWFVALVEDWSEGAVSAKDFLVAPDEAA